MKIKQILVTVCIAILFLIIGYQLRFYQTGYFTSISPKATEILQSEHHSPPSVVIEPGSGVEEASYIIFKDGEGFYYAKSGSTGAIELKDTDVATLTNRAINQLMNGGRIFIKAATYSTPNTISINGRDDIEIFFEDGVILQPLNENMTVISVHDSDRVRLLNPRVYSWKKGVIGVKVNASDHVKIFNPFLSLMPGSGVNNSRGVYAIDVNDFLVSGGYIKRASNGIGIYKNVLNMMYDNTIQNVHVYDISQMGIHARFNERLLIDGNTVENINDNAIDVLNSKLFTVSNNKIENGGFPNGAAIGIYSEDGYYSEFGQITNNVINNSNSTATIGARDILIQSNIITNARKNGISVTTSGAGGTFYSTRINILNNIINKTKESGIYISPLSSEVYVKNNEFRNIGGSVIAGGIPTVVRDNIGIPTVYSEASYIIFTDGTMVYAQNGSTGSIEFVGTASTVIQSTINALTNGGKIFLKQGTYSLSSPLTISDSSNPRTFSFVGEGLRNTVITSSISDDYMIKTTLPGWQKTTIEIDDITFEGGGNEYGALNLQNVTPNFGTIRVQGSFKDRANDYYGIVTLAESGAPNVGVHINSLTISLSTTVRTLLFTKLDNLFIGSLALSHGSASGINAYSFEGQTVIGHFGYYVGNGHTCTNVLRNPGSRAKMIISRLSVDKSTTGAVTNILNFANPNTTCVITALLDKDGTVATNIFADAQTAANTRILGEHNSKPVKNSGTATVSNNEWVSHELATTPKIVTLTPQSEATVWVNNRNETHFQIGVSSGTVTVDWYAEA